MANIIFSGAEGGGGEKVTCQPTASDGIQTMPHRETVAGEATRRSSTSNSMRMVTPFNLIRSPATGSHGGERQCEGNRSGGRGSCCRRARCSCFQSRWRPLGHQTQSISCEKDLTIAAVRCGPYLSGEVSLLALRMMVEPRPSVHSLVSRLKFPYLPSNYLRDPFFLQLTILPWRSTWG